MPKPAPCQQRLNSHFSGSLEADFPNGPKVITCLKSGLFQYSSKTVSLLLNLSPAQYLAALCPSVHLFNYYLLWPLIILRSIAHYPLPKECDDAARPDGFFQLLHENLAARDGQRHRRYFSARVLR